MNYDQQIEMIQRRKAKAEKRAKERALAALIELNREKPVSVRVNHSTSQSYGGYDGDTLITHRHTDYLVYAGDAELGSFSHEQSAIDFINKTFAPAAQAKAYNAQRRTGLKLERAMQESNAADEAVRKLKVDVRWVK